MEIVYFLLILCLLQPWMLCDRGSVCWYTVEVADCSGYDIHHATLNLTACRAACSARDDCRSFQHHDEDNECWLKNFICSKRLLTHTGDRRYAQYTKQCQPEQQVCDYAMERADCVGHDIRNAQLNLTACEEACSARADCRSFQLWRGEDCWLKNYVCRQDELRNVGDWNYAQYTKQSCEPVTTPEPSTTEAPFVVDSSVPSAIRDCTITREDDRRKMAASWVSFENTTESACARKCQEIPVCDAATFTNKTKTCAIHSRRDFTFGSMLEENCCVMYQKHCNYKTYANPPRKGQALCPMEKGAPKPARKYAYREVPYKKSYEEGEYMCRIDHVCAGLSFYYANRNNRYFFTFYYDVTPEGGSTVANMSVAVKNCQQTGPICNFMTAYFDRRLVYVNQLRSHPLDMQPCAYSCQLDSDCDAVTWTSFYRGKKCQKYQFRFRRPDRYELRDYTVIGTAITWVKDAPQCRQNITANHS